MKKFGYCKQCLRNVPHELFFRWPLFSVLNRFPEFMGGLWLSSWNCCACEKHVIVLRRPLDEATTDSSATEMSDVRPFVTPRSEGSRGMFLRRLFHRNNPEESDIEQPEMEATAEAPAGEKVGNFLRSEESLILQSTRASRYTKKYRESIVDRILSGKATITQIRNELGVTERDVLEWLNERVFRQQQKIAKLTQVVKSVQQLTLESDSELTATSGLAHLSSTPEDDSANSNIRLFEDSPLDSSSPPKPNDKNTIDGSVQQRKSNP